MSYLKTKENKLKEIIAQYDNMVLGFSGGVDSSLLALAAQEELEDKFFAVIVNSQFYPSSELKEAELFAKKHKIKYTILDVDVLADPLVKVNSPQRCYYCKKKIFGLIKSLAANRGFSCVADGTNVDDAQVYRPGSRALQELGIVSPLQEAGLTKFEIRTMLRQRREPVSQKPALACLASRIPYGEELTEEHLHRVERAEAMLRIFGWQQLRVRSHGDLARLEIGQNDFAQFSKESFRKEVTQLLEQAGFKFVTLDLKKYRMGSFDK